MYMKRLCGRFWLVVLLTLSIGLFTLPLFAVTKRGQCPECQEECLKYHAQAMHEVAGKYKKTGDRLGYQTDVDHLVNEYRICLDNCREFYPVK